MLPCREQDLREALGPSSSRILEQETTIRQMCRAEMVTDA